MAAVKEARGVTLGDNKNADAVKKRGPKNATSGNGKGATKRKRGKVDHEADTESIGSDDGERALKKVKHEVKSEEEKDVKVETDEV